MISFIYDFSGNGLATSGHWWAFDLADRPKRPYPAFDNEIVSYNLKGGRTF